MKKLDTRSITALGLLVAVEIVLSRFCSINAWDLKIGFSFLPVAVAAMRLGPLEAAVVAAVEELVRQLMLLVALETRIDDILHLRARLKPFCQGQGVFRLAGDAQRQRAGAAQGEPGVERADVGAQIVVVIAHPVDILFAARDNAAEGVAVAHIVFGAGLDHDIRAQIQRTQDIGGEERPR